MLWPVGIFLIGVRCQACPSSKISKQRIKLGLIRVSSLEEKKNELSGRKRVVKYYTIATVD